MAIRNKQIQIYLFLVSFSSVFRCAALVKNVILKLKFTSSFFIYR